MGHQVTIEVSERVSRSAQRSASRTHRRVEEVLADWLEDVVTEIPIDDLPDEEIINLTMMQLTPDQQSLLDDLLDKNREGMLDDGARKQLSDLMRVYEHGLLRKSQ